LHSRIGREKAGVTPMGPYMGVGSRGLLVPFTWGGGGGKNEPQAIGRTTQQKRKIYAAMLGQDHSGEGESV